MFLMLFFLAVDVWSSCETIPSHASCSNMAAMWKETTNYSTNAPVKRIFEVEKCNKTCSGKLEKFVTEINYIENEGLLRTRYMVLLTTCSVHFSHQIKSSNKI